MTTARAIGRRQRGYNLIEILIAMTMGALLIGSVIFSVTGAGNSGRKQDAMGQMTEDGQIALNLLSWQLRMAGFWMPQPLAVLDPQTMIRGCRNGFSSTTVAFGSLACTAGTGNDSVALRYDAREPGGTPRDCLGNFDGDLADAAADNGVVDNRFYIATSPAGNPALYCRGNGGGDPQMLLDNVESLQLRYGLSATTGAPTGPILIDPKVYSGQVVRYVRADQLTYTASCSNAAPPTTPNWCGVTSVRVCIVMRSSNNVSENTTTQYVDCDGVSQTPTDRRMRRAMETTISLRNRTTVAGG